MSRDLHRTGGAPTPTGLNHHHRDILRVGESFARSFYTLGLVVSVGSSPGIPTVGAIKMPTVGAVKMPTVGAVKKPTVGAVKMPTAGAVKM